MGATYVFFALACAITWLLALPTAVAWMRHQPPAPAALACAGLSAFGPLLAAVVVAARQRQLRVVFGKLGGWRVSGWILLALAAPALVHVVATALFVAAGGRPAQWLHPPTTPEALAALVVFPLGEEPGWRGFAYPRMTARFGIVRGALLLGAAWGVWHLAYSVTPDGRFDALGFALLVIELPLYSVVLAWLFERANRSLTVAIAFHAGAHLDHLEPAARGDLRLAAAHLVVLAGIAARLLARYRNRQPM